MEFILPFFKRWCKSKYEKKKYFGNVQTFISIWLHFRAKEFNEGEKFVSALW